MISFTLILMVAIPCVMSSHKCTTKTDNENIIVNCQGLGLRSVPTGLSVHTTQLSLRHNQLMILLPKAFRDTPWLTHIDLSHNNLKRLNNDTFSGLRNLTHLNLNDNYLCYDDTSFPPGLFADQTKLRSLHIYSTLIVRDNGCLDQYPEETMKVLLSIQEFYLSGTTPFYFRPVFRTFYHLKKLILGVKHCAIRRLTNNTLENLAGSKIEELTIVWCHIDTIEPMAFSHFKYLRTLNLACSLHISLQEAMVAISNIPSHLNTLILDGIMTYPSAGQPPNMVKITSQLFCSENMKNLKRLSLKSIHLVLIDYTFVYCLQNIQQISIGYNFAPFQMNSYTNISFQPNVLDISYLFYPSTDLYRNNYCIDDIEFGNIENFFRHPNVNLLKYHVNSVCPNSRYMLSAVYMDHTGITIPQKFQNGLPADVQYHFNYSINLDVRLVNFSHNSVYCLCLELRGCQNILVVDISYCKIRSVLVKWYIPSLRELYINNNKLASTLFTLRDFFNQMANLLILDLSNNQFTHLPTNIFTGLKKLNHLLLNDNF